MRLLILGAGGFAREARVWAHQCGHAVIGFFEEFPVTRKVPGKSPLPIFNTFKDKSLVFLGAVGDSKLRIKLVHRAQTAGLRAADAMVHPSCIVGSNVAVGVGSIVCPGSILTTDISIGKHCLINIGVTIGHDVVIEDWTTISPGAHISGNVKIRRGAYIGTGAVIREGEVIGAGATVGMGAAVIKGVPDGETWVGVPARRM